MTEKEKEKAYLADLEAKNLDGFNLLEALDLAQKVFNDIQHFKTYSSPCWHYATKLRQEVFNNPKWKEITLIKDATKKERHALLALVPLRPLKPLI